jgi:hypothetical protein
VVVGTNVSFPNGDIVFHNVYSESPCCKFSLPGYPKGETRTVLFPKPGIVQLFCDIHAHMSAFILVLSNPYFCMPDAQHHYRLDNVPPGKYTVKAWHPFLEPVSKSVQMSSGVVSVDLNL